MTKIWTLFSFLGIFPIFFKLLELFGFYFPLYFLLFVFCAGCLQIFGIDILGCIKNFFQSILPSQIVENLRIDRMHHIVLQINIAHDDSTNNSGYIHFIDFTISSTEIDKSAFDLESDCQDKPYCCYQRVFFDLESKFPLLKDSKNKFKLVYFGK